MNLAIKIDNVVFGNPIWVASGTFGYGKEFEGFVDLDQVGAIVTKTVTLQERKGNPSPRLVETASGLLNSIGIENKGAVHLKEHDYNFLKNINARSIVSIAGSNVEEFIKCAEILCEEKFPHAIELNLSCPNVEGRKGKFKLIAQDPEMTKNIIQEVKKVVACPIIAKLTPNVTDIAAIAVAAEEGGASAVAVANTYFGMAIDVKNKKPILGNKIGGLSGPAIKPLALKSIWDVYRSVTIPIIGIGGIMTGEDAIEFMLCGARAIQVGTANLIDPSSQARILQEFIDYLQRHQIDDVVDLIGQACY